MKVKRPELFNQQTFHPAADIGSFRTRGFGPGLLIFFPIPA